MAKAFTTWTVLPHKPIEKLAENLWRVEGTLGNNRRVMTLARLKNGDLLIHNGVALDENEMAEVEAFGRPAYIVVPNGFHRMDSRIFKDRYPQARIICPLKAAGRVRQVVPVEDSHADVAADDDVKLYPIEGAKEELVLEVRSSDGVTLVFNDALFNVPPLGGLIGFALGPTGRAAVPRVIRWLGMSSKSAFKAHLHRMAQMDGLRRIIVSHGKMITDNPGAILKAAADEL